MNSELHPALNALVQRWEKSGNTDLADLMEKLVSAGFYPEEILQYLTQNLSIGIGALMHHLAGHGMGLGDLTTLLRKTANWTDSEILNLWVALSDKGVLLGHRSPTTINIAPHESAKHLPTAEPTTIPQPVQAVPAIAPSTEETAPAEANTAVASDGVPSQPTTDASEATPSVSVQAPATLKVQVSQQKEVLDKAMRKVAMNAMMNAPQTHGLHIGGFNLTASGIEMHISRSNHGDLVGAVHHFLDHVEATLHANFPKLKEHVEQGKVLDPDTVQLAPQS